MRRVMKVSVVVPIYNSENTLVRCLNSLSNQSADDFEVIMVDDGSTDSSSLICKSYSDKYDNFKYVYQDNQGPLKARINGIEQSYGKYIAFADSDDWLEIDHIKNLLEIEEREHPDMIATGCYVENSKGVEEIVNNNLNDGVYEKDSLDNLFTNMLYQSGFFEFGILPYLWTKLFDREKLLYSIRGIDPFLYDGEDVAVIFPYILKCTKIVISKKATYHYMYQSNSLSHYKRNTFYKNSSRLYLYLYEIFSESVYKDVLVPQLDQYMRMMIWQKDPKRYIESQKYLFPFHLVSQNSKIILYGAGLVGQSYAFQLSQIDYCKLVAWVDKQYDTFPKSMDISNPNDINKLKYDYIVVAVEDNSVKNAIINFLTGEELSVEKSKII